MSRNTFKFPVGNSIQFFVGNMPRQGVPSGVEFTFIRVLGDLYEFRANDYHFRKNYGPGNVFVFGSNLPVPLKNFIDNIRAEQIEA